MELVSILGLIAGGLTSLAFFPQAIKVIKSRDTKSLSLIMYLAFTVGIILWLIYGIVRRDLALFSANIVILGPAVLILFFKMTEKKRQGK